MEQVAVIGAGPGGIAAARFLKDRGFAPKIFESYGKAGGQWCHANPNSGVWPDMVTNTYLEATRFSDAEYPDGVALFPHNTDVLAYMQRYARDHGLLDDANFGCKLVVLETCRDGYRLTFEKDGQRTVETFSKVVIATGRFNNPVIPAISGAEKFTGEMGIIHASNYKDPGAYRDKSVIVAGGSISALEIASDLAMLGAASVHLTQRRQRYVNPKMVTGVPIEYYAFTYARGALALAGDPVALARNDEALVRKYGGDPSRYGAPPPHPDFKKAGVTGSQHYLNLVAEARLTPVPWISDINGKTVIFEDGRKVQADGIIAGTGFALHLPFLSDEISTIVKNDTAGLELDEFTFHPDLPGLAFVGMWSQLGSYPTPLELQARYIAYTWSGSIPAKSVQDMRSGVAASVSEGHHVGYRRQNEMALRFARLCGVDPEGQVDDALMEKVRRSATTGLLYRLAGPDSLPDAAAQFEKQFERYGPAD